MTIILNRSFCSISHRLCFAAKCTRCRDSHTANYTVVVHFVKTSHPWSKINQNSLLGNMGFRSNSFQEFSHSVHVRRHSAICKQYHKCQRTLSIHYAKNVNRVYLSQTQLHHLQMVVDKAGTNSITICFQISRLRPLYVKSFLYFPQVYLIRQFKKGFFFLNK